MKPAEWCGYTAGCIGGYCWGLISNRYLSTCYRTFHSDTTPNIPYQVPHNLGGSLMMIIPRPTLDMICTIPAPDGALHAPSGRMDLSGSGRAVIQYSRKSRE